MIKELARAKKLYNGVRMASTAYPDSLLAMAVVGTLKGGFLFLFSLGGSRGGPPLSLKGGRV